MKSNNNLIIINNNNQLIIIVSWLLVGTTFDPERQDKSKVKNNTPKCLFSHSQKHFAQCLSENKLFSNLTCWTLDFINYHCSLLFIHFSFRRLMF